MLNIKWIRDHPETLDRSLERRGEPPCSADIITLDGACRAAQTALQTLQERRKSLSKEIGILKQAGEQADTLMQEMAALKAAIPEKEDEKRQAEEERTKILSRIPNLLADDVPTGQDENDNVECHRNGELPSLKTPKDHVALGGKRLDSKVAAAMSGARFTVLKGKLARLERALGQFMLDVHTTEFDFMEISPPLLVRDNALFGTGQLPKFSEDLFQTTTGHWLIPTAEVPLTNLVADQILDSAELPLRFVTLTPCFRSEAGAAGKDTKGMIREHQFWKVELVAISSADQAAAEHTRILNAAEEILKRLKLPFRTVILCSGDTGFSARKTWDIEVWLPGQGKYREISSCSDFGDFQARRMNARYRTADGPRFVHTQNGSALAIGRTLIAVMENYQQEDGTILIPDVLQPYIKGLTKINPDEY